jgi:hypothetical protein
VFENRVLEEAVRESGEDYITRSSKIRILHRVTISKE